MRRWNAGEAAEVWPCSCFILHPSCPPATAGGSDSSLPGEPAIRVYPLDADMTTAIAFVNPDTVDVGFQPSPKWRGQQNPPAQRNLFIHNGRRARPPDFYGRGFWLK